MVQTILARTQSLNIGGNFTSDFRGDLMDELLRLAEVLGKDETLQV